MVDYSYERMMNKFDPEEWNSIFNTVKASIESLATNNEKYSEEVPVGMRDALIFNETAQILGQTSLLYRFHKELQFNEEDLK